MAVCLEPVILHIENVVPKRNTATYLPSFKTRFICREVVLFNVFIFIIDVTLRSKHGSDCFYRPFLRETFYNQKPGFFLENMITYFR